MKKSYWTILLIFISISLLTGCIEQTGSTVEKDKLTIATLIPEYNSEVTEFYNYKNTFNIEVKSVLADKEDLAKHWTDLDIVINDFIEQNDDIDFIYGFPTEYLNGLIELGNIKEITGEIKTSALQNSAPAVMKPIEEAGSGKIFALPPYFDAKVLVYNKKIFKELNLVPPISEMSWVKTQELSDDIQKKSAYKGIALGQPDTDEDFYSLYQILSRPIPNLERKAEGLTVINKLNKKYWTLFKDIYIDNEKATLEDFIKGKSAMAVFPTGILFDQDFISFYGDYKPSDWGIAPLPEFDENPGGQGYTDSLFALTKNSDSILSAKFLNHISSQEVAKNIIATGMLPTVTNNELNTLLTESHGFDLSTIYKQPGAIIEAPLLNADEFYKVQADGTDSFVHFLQGKISIEEALTNYEEKTKTE